MALSGAVVQRPKLQAPTPVKRWVVGCYQSCSNQVLHVITQSERLKPEIGMRMIFLVLGMYCSEDFGFCIKCHVIFPGFFECIV